jgi:glutaconate CoA-transferase subunit B
VYGFNEESKHMELLSIHPGVTLDQIKENSGFDIIIPEHVSVTTPPSKQELAILEKIDPLGMVIGK